MIEGEAKELELEDYDGKMVLIFQTFMPRRPGPLLAGLMEKYSGGRILLAEVIAKEHLELSRKT